MTHYEQKAFRAVAAFLSGQKEPVMLFDISCIADGAARRAGKKRELYPSLYDYENLVSGGWRCRWLEAKGGSGDGLLMVVPPNFREGQTQSQQLLLGGGVLVHHQLQDCTP